jgi:NADH-quinone oxidoreductase subunit J
LALLASAAVFGGIAWLGLRHTWQSPVSRMNEGGMRDIGISLLTTYSLAFEVISLVLLVAILGALVVARYGRTKP